MSIDQAASRRKFFQFLAASPLVATSEAIAETLLPKVKLSDPLTWGPLDPNVLIKTPKEAINVFDFEPVMRQRVSPAHFAYMASGIDDEVTLRANRTDFEKFQLRPRRLVDVSKIDMSVNYFGVKFASPIIIAPTGGNRAYHADGEIAVAKASKTSDTLQILATQTTVPIEQVMAARGKPFWFQLYATNRFDIAVHHVKRAEAAGCNAVAVTLDILGGRNQETLSRLQPTDSSQCSSCHDRSSLAASMRRKSFWDGVDLTGMRGIRSSALTWDFVKRLRDQTKMKMILKGIVSWEDAGLAADAGFDGIIVSNHGGRSEDTGRSTIDALPEIIDAVKGRMPVFVDSGFRRGTDMAKALCMGASGVCIGRPYLWGLGAFGQAGVERVLELLRFELFTIMQQLGAPSLKDLKPSMVRRA
jgi:isopentenyl diphosphate isomerase/L-lactate dehydrogenase-like FMN-dependent dehydrogenase